MKYFFILLQLMVLSLSSFTQTIEVMKIFPDGRPFFWGTTWDSNEGAPPGPAEIIFLNNGISICIDTTPPQYIVLNKNFSVLNNLLAGSGIRRVIFGNLFIAFSASSDLKKLHIFDKKNFQKPVIEITLSNDWWDFPAIIAGKYIFRPTDDKRLLSWEIDIVKGTYVYRDQAQTMKLLESGLAEQIGLKEPYNELRFTSRNYSMGKISTPVVPFSFEGYTYNQKQLLSFNLYENSISGFYTFIGTDSRGLYYFSAISPYLSIPSKSFSKEGESDNNPVNATYTNPDKQLVYAIADPWQKKIIFRSLPKYSWNPPADAEHGLLGSYPAAIHPDGHIYFFDGDVKTKTFILKRVVNDWWQELGFNKKQVGIVNDNRVRVRKTPSTNAEILGYVYEMEYALILEKGEKQETIGGKTSYWYKVRMWDDRTGWVFGAFLDIQ